MLAVTAVIALAIGAILRRGTGAVAAVVVVIVVPYLFTVAAPVLPSRAAGGMTAVRAQAPPSVDRRC